MITSFLSIQDFQHDHQTFIITYTYLRFISILALSFSSIVYLLFLFDSMGYAKGGLVLTSTVITQFIFDYPTGTIGDYIGQKWVLVMAYGTLAIGYGMLFFHNSFLIFVLSGIFLGFGYAQHSGALESWFDNYYQRNIEMEEDKDRKIYGFLTSRLGTIIQLGSVISFVCGTIISSFIGRHFVFIIQSLILSLNLLVTVKYIHVEKTISSEKSENYFFYLKNGIRFISSSKTMFFFSFSIVFYMLSNTITFNLVTYPLLYSYAGTDYNVGIVQMMITVAGIILGIKMANLSQRFKTSHAPIILMLGFICNFPIIILITELMPGNNKLNFTSLLCIITISVISVQIVLRIGTILLNRLIIDWVPSTFRNSIYSLIPSLCALFSIITLPLGGIILETIGFSFLLMFNFLVAILCPILLFLSLNYMKKDKKINIQK